MQEMKRAPVILSEYQPDWPAKFALEKEHLARLVGRWLHGSIEHIGSTAIPGLIAKPVIDVMFGVRSLDDSRPVIDVLTRNGYEYSPYKGDVMHWFCKPSDAFRTHHLHLVPYESPMWHERIRFRDLLLADPGVADEYAALKRELARRYRHDREAYTDEKWPFIKRVLEENALPAK